MTPGGAVITWRPTPSTAQWVSLAPDGLGNVVLADNKAHAVWRVNLQTNAPTLIGNYPVGSPSELEDVGIAVDPSGNYLILNDNNSTLSMFSMTPTGTATAVTLTGVAAKNTNGRLLRYNGGYAFVSYGDNTIDTITFTVPPGSSTPPVATIAVLSARPHALRARRWAWPRILTRAPLYRSDERQHNAGLTRLKNSSSGTCSPNCLWSDPIFFRHAASVTSSRSLTRRSLILPMAASGPRVAFTFLNTADVPASYSINFYNPDGSAAQVPFPGGSTGTLRGTLPPRGFQLCGSGQHRRGEHIHSFRSAQRRRRDQRARPVPGFFWRCFL